MRNRLALRVASIASALLAHTAAAQTLWLVSNDPAESPDFAHPVDALNSPLVRTGDTIEVSQGLGPYIITTWTGPIDFGTKDVVLRNQADEIPVLRAVGSVFPNDFVVIHIGGGQTSQARLEGFQVEADGLLQTAMRVYGDPITRRCTFLCDASDRVVIITSGSPRFEECVFLGAESQGPVVYALGQGTSVTIDRCRFEGCLTGGGAVLTNCSATITRCEFIDNSSTRYANDVTFISPAPAARRIDRCRFRHQHEGKRPAIDARGQADLVNCVFDRYITTAWIVDSAPGLGIVNLINCTASRCEAAMFINYGAPVFLRNSIVWANEFTNQHWLSGTVWNSLVPANLSPVFNPGNVNADPLFTNPAAGDYTLQPGSPAIDAGSNALVPSGIALDYVGLPRFVDDPASPNTGVGPAPIADMGAHEFQPQNLCRPDLTTTSSPGTPGFGEPDGFVNTEDFLYYMFLISQSAHGSDMTTTAIPGSPGYGTPDGIINNDDFFYYLAAIFAAGC